MNSPVATPFSPISLPISASTPAPLRDIVAPFPFFQYTEKEIATVLGIALLLSGLLAWIIWKKCQRPPLTPRETALKDLASMKERLMEGSDHDFGILVSSLLRRYLNIVFELAAPRQTTEEFLESLRGNHSFTLREQESLALFLNQSDLLKFAGGKAQETERLALIIAAENFVNRGETLADSENKS